MTGLFVTFEGGEGAGKSTQLRLLAEHLKRRGVQVVTTREPGGTPAAETLRDLLVNGSTDRWLPMSELLLLTAGRYDHVRRVILPALEAGHTVLCDRFIDSTLAYQGYGLGVELDEIRAVSQQALHGFEPDLTFVFDLPPALGLRRALDRDGNLPRYEAMDMAFHERLHHGYRAIAAAAPERCVLLDATQDIARIAALIAAELDRRLGTEA